MEWHPSCLVCSECGINLDEYCTCFMREGKPYCKNDFIRSVCHLCQRRISLKWIWSLVWCLYTGVCTWMSLCIPGSEKGLGSISLLLGSVGLPAAFLVGLAGSVQIPLSWLHPITLSPISYFGYWFWGETTSGRVVFDSAADCLVLGLVAAAPHSLPTPSLISPFPVVTSLGTSICLRQLVIVAGWSGTFTV